MTSTMTPALLALTQELRLFCQTAGAQPASADDLLADLQAGKSVGNTDDQEAAEYLQGFIRRWEVAMANAPRDEALAGIAAVHLNLETLQRRNSDRLDFSDQAVWSIQAALEAAYAAGKAER